MVMVGMPQPQDAPAIGTVAAASASPTMSAVILGLFVGPSLITLNQSKETVFGTIFGDL